MIECTYYEQHNVHPNLTDQQQVLLKKINEI